MWVWVWMWGWGSHVHTSQLLCFPLCALQILRPSSYLGAFCTSSPCDAELGIDGGLTDFPGTLVKFLDSSKKLSSGSSK